MGRPIGALGLTRRCAVLVPAEDKDEATLRIYEKYEHISGDIELTLVREGELL